MIYSLGNPLMLVPRRMRRRTREVLLLDDWLADPMTMLSETRTSCFAASSVSSPGRIGLRLLDRHHSVLIVLSRSDVRRG